ncbi:MAG: C40 family peptidase [Chlorobi bacterium]|nr:C40 family peptidase [Chlorobiota bacterium]
MNKLNFFTTASPCWKVIGIVTIAVVFVSGCANLEPVPRFRSATKTFSARQLPQRLVTSSDLLDPASIAHYSILKERDLENRHTQSFHDELSLAGEVAGTGNKGYEDEIGLDGEELLDQFEYTQYYEGDLPTDDISVGDFLASDAYNNTILNPSEERDEVDRSTLMQEIVNLLGVRYRYGGTDAIRGLDCSAFTGTVYSRVFGIRLPRTSRAQFTIGKKVPRDELAVGDLVFFKTMRGRSPVSHVGIYIGNDYFAHASRKRGVTVTSLKKAYYARTYVSSRRIIPEQHAEVLN